MPDATKDTNVAGPNKRPREVVSFIINGGTHDYWYLNNRGAKRFFVVNLDDVIQDIGVNHTKLETIFDEAEKLIASETEWPSQFEFEYTCSHTQIYPEVRNDAKHFGRAVVVIVAMELLAAERKKGYNVYDKLRILPAQYFVDGLDKSRLEQLRNHHRGLTAEQKAELFGDDATLDIDALLLKAIDQVYGDDLLLKHASGHCFTKFTCELLMGFINDKFPKELHVGPVLSSGETSHSKTLGRKNVAPKLRVPKKIDVANFPLTA